MSANPELKITISADANGVKAGTQQAEAAIQDMAQGGGDALRTLAADFAHLTASVMAIKDGLDSIAAGQSKRRSPVTSQAMKHRMAAASGYPASAPPPASIISTNSQKNPLAMQAV